ncbi:MAG: hypothetical protein HY242_09630 [Afipia sp.]|nr:hypothetical protein [Afipia sp.]
MKAFALIALSSGFLALWATPSSATTCAQAVYACKTEANRHADGVARCDAAGEQCKKTGEWVGPFTGKTFKASR